MCSIESDDCLNSSVVCVYACVCLIQFGTVAQCEILTFCSTLPKSWLLYTSVTLGGTVQSLRLHPACIVSSSPAAVSWLLSEGRGLRDTWQSEKPALHVDIGVHGPATPRGPLWSCTHTQTVSQLKTPKVGNPTSHKGTASKLPNSALERGVIITILVGKQVCPLLEGSAISKYQDCHATILKK